MMTIYRNWTAVVLAISLVSCSQNDDSYIGGSISGGQSDVNSIYPLPPSQWMGETNPYYSAGWVGDIMPFYDGGKFHIYFLHDAQNKPAGKGFHDIHEFESTNLADFTYKGQSVPYGDTTLSDDFGVGTGSVVKVGNMYYFYYTGHNGNPQFLQDNARESVLCATSTDLKNWTKVPNFKITAPAGYYDYDFRDPHVFYNDEAGEYQMLVSTQTDPARKAVLLLFSTNDPAAGNWQVQAPLYTTTPQENYLMMECADIFKMGNYWYLFFSENWSGNKGTHYRMASSSAGPWATPEHDMIDGEYYYAAKTASDGNKRYAFAWTARKSPENDTGNKEWAGNMVIHELKQNADGTLYAQAPEAVSSHFIQNQALTVKEQLGSVSENNGSYTVTASDDVSYIDFEKAGSKAKITAKVTPGEGSTGFKFNVDDDGNYYTIAFEPQLGRLAGYNSAGQEVTRVPVNITAGNQYDIEMVMDGSVCVLYLNGKAAMSNRIYGRESRPWGIVANQGSIGVNNIIISKP